jgi:hypothetical protein
VAFDRFGSNTLIEKESGKERSASWSKQQAGRKPDNYFESDPSRVMCLNSKKPPCEKIACIEDAH